MKDYVRLPESDTQIEKYKRMKEENDLLWCIYRTCVHCPDCPTDGTVYGCNYQKYLDLKFLGVCMHRR